MHDDGVFDQAIAESYDRIHGDGSSAAERLVASVLRDLAFDGTALEFAIGTGRIAVPLHHAGVRVQGIELSAAMVDQLRQKPEGADIPAVVGDMTTTRVDGAFSLVFLVYNTIDNLTTQDAQVACFANAAAHLTTGGHFVIETLVPPIQKIPFGETMRAFNRSDTHWGIDEFDVVTQNYASHHVRLEEETYVKNTVPFRYAWPAELDLMARTAGMRLVDRWADWDKSPFTATSPSHVSVWRKD
ncbi:MAG: class I SAM-dependent methyltransferase [Yoonia sp.]|uniref:class I SAM-dependent DNA methyltransferase n=1 Tax=Yoonia sp. TaxID=2212373 RepID=UPI003267B65A